MGKNLNDEKVTFDKQINTKTKFRLFFAILSSIISFCSVFSYYTFFHRPLGSINTYAWAETDTFDISKIATIEKDPNKDFVIMNLADVQLCDLELFPYNFKIKAELIELVERVKPDLITLTGDQVWSNEIKISMNFLADILDGFKIPWAPVYGNHDLDGCWNDNAFSDFYEGRKYCLYSRGPNNLGVIGNYVVNITENGKLVRTLYMLNHGTNEYFTEEQMAWFNWTANGIKNYYGENAMSMCFYHIPTYQFAEAYNAYSYGNADAIGDVNMFNGVWGSYSDRLFFYDMLDANVVDIVCGHYHSNSFTILYNGVRFTHALKTGETSFHHEDENVYMNGATVFTISKDDTKVDVCYVSKDKYGVKNSDIV